MTGGSFCFLLTLPSRQALYLPPGFKGSEAGLLGRESGMRGALLQQLSFLCTYSQRDLLFCGCLVHLGLGGEAGVYSEQRSF